MLALNDQEMQALRALAEPIEQGQRWAFLETVATELMAAQAKVATVGEG